MEDILNILKELLIGLEFNDRTNYIVVCKFSMSNVRAWERDGLPASMKGEKPDQVIYLMPEISHRLNQKEQVYNSAKALEELMGLGYKVDVCATKNDFIMGDDNFITLPL